MTDYHGNNIHIYFVRPVDRDGPVKIGHSTDIQRRLHQLMLWSPVDLVVAASFVGSKKIERRIHRALADRHWRKEWFNISDEVRELIEAAKGGETMRSSNSILSVALENI